MITLQWRTNCFSEKNLSGAYSSCCSHKPSVMGEFCPNKQVIEVGFFNCRHLVSLPVLFFSVSGERKCLTTFFQWLHPLVCVCVMSNFQHSWLLQVVLNNKLQYNTYHIPNFNFWYLIDSSVIMYEHKLEVLEPNYIYCLLCSL